MKWIKKTPLIQYNKNDPILYKLAKINGINNVEEFINPSPRCLHDPYLLANIEEAANAICSAITSGQKIAVSYDVDADGLTSGSLVYRYLKMYTDNIYIMYCQREDGHGIELQMDMYQKDTGLVIICDSSTNSAEACREITKFGGKVVILDHHEKERDNPYAIIVNPQLDDYPNKQLSGAGVAYKVLTVVNEMLGKHSQGAIDYYLDLVATGLCSDVMSMREMENRYLVNVGLKNINNPGLKAIFKSAGKDIRNITSTDIGFLIGPMLNGAARMGKLELAIKLLITDDENECKKITKQIKELNEVRKNLETEYYNLIVDQINENDKVIVVIHDDIDKSFNGLIATKIANEYNRPAIVMRNSGDKYVGSYRTYGDFNMKAFLESLPETDFVAGHPGAGGFSVYKKDLDSVKKEFDEQINFTYVEPSIEYDLELDASEINIELIEEVEKFNAITGRDVQPAKFVVRNVFVDDVEVIGKNKDTIKVSCNNLVLMKFKINDAEKYASNFEPFETYDVVGTLNLNRFFHWGERKWIITNQIFIDDFKKVVDF